MIPNLDKRRVDQLLEWLVFELRQAKSDRAGLESDWVRYAKLYRARPESEFNDFPFKGASNLKIPVAATDVETTVSELMGIIFGSPNLWSTEGLRPDWLEFAARLEEFLEWAQEAELNMYDVLNDWVLELTKLGTGVLKTRYRRDQRTVFEWRETAPGQTVQQLARRIIANRPDVSWTPIANFYVPATTKKLADAMWCGERIELSWDTLLARVRDGIYRPDILDHIARSWRDAQPRSEFSRYQSEQEILDKLIPSRHDLFELFEFWPKYDILGTGEPLPLVCTIHVPSNTYARIDFNPFFHQEAPYSTARFIRREGSFYGIGMCEIDEMCQEEVTALHNQRIDSGTIRNTAAWVAQRGIGLKQDEPWWPGRVMLVDDINGVKPFPVGYEAQPTVNEEQLVVNYFRQRSGISDYDRGGAGNPAISYTTATTTIQMLQQGRKLRDQTLREINAAVAEVGRRVVELYQQFDQMGKVYEVMGDKDGAVVNAVLKFPLDTIRTGVAIKVTSTTSQLNKETKIRTDQIIFGLMTQFYQQMFQAMTVVVNPQIPLPLRVLAGQMIHGGLVLARRILDNYEEQDLDSILPSIEQLNALTGQLAQAIGAGGPPGQATGPGTAPMAGGPAGGAGIPPILGGGTSGVQPVLQAPPIFPRP